MPVSQAPTKSASVDYYRDISSSPDPLTTSFGADDNITSTVASANRSSPSQRKSAYATTQQRRTPKTTHHDFGTIPSPPFRAVSEQNISPWKIRVTVEAEQEDSEMENPSARRVTRTIKVPLRQDSSPVDQDVSFARGRRSQGSPSKGKRSATPLRSGKTSGRMRRQSVTNLDVRPLGDDADEDDWLKQKRSPRKRKASRSRKSTRDGEVTTQASGNTAVSTFEIRQDTDAEDDHGIVHQEQASHESESPELRAVNLNRVAMRPQALSIKSTANGEGDMHDSQGREVSTMVPTKKPMEARKVSANSAKSYPTPSPTSSYRGDSDEVGKALDEASIGHEGFDTILESEGFTMIDLETLPSAKQYFSSPAEEESSQAVGGLREVSSQKEVTSTTIERHGQSSSQPGRSAPSEVVAYPTLSTEDSDLSSTVPSSPPSQEQEKSFLQVMSSSSSLARKVTPQPYSSPKLPSPPKQEIRRTPRHQHRGSVSALAAGIALQGVLSPKRSSDGAIGREERVSSPSQDRERPERLFEGFDSGTQRELRAGLRFGEELARRQSPGQPTTASPKNSPPPKESKPVGLGIDTTTKGPASVSNQAATQVWRGENLVQRTPVQVTSSGSAKVLAPERSAPQTPQTASVQDKDEELLDFEARRQREWQLERDEIIREIQNANESQVIVIDSDSEDETDASKEGQEANAQSGPSHQVTSDRGTQEDDEEEDIWLAEAKNSSSPGPEAHLSPQSHEKDYFSRAEETAQHERAKEAVNRPRRSLIPSPWKRGDDIEAPQTQTSFVSTNADDMSGLLCYRDPESKLLFGAGEIKRQQLRQRRGSGRFDIDLMAGPPRKEPLEEESVDVTEDSDIQDGSGGEHESRIQAGPGEEDSVADMDAREFLEESRLSVKEGPQPREDSIISLVGDSTPKSSPAQPVKIAVKFNESSISTPPQTTTNPQNTQLQPPTPETNVASSPQRPPTPRSALKGSRQSFGEGLACERPNTPTMVRRVVFSERSRGVDIDGQESSFSMRSASDDSTAGELDVQLTRELHAHDMARVARAREAEVLVEEEVRDRHQRTSTNARTWVPVDVSTKARPPPAPEFASEPEPEPAKKGWTSWLWGSKTTSQPVLESSSLAGHGQRQPQTKHFGHARMDGTEDETDASSQDQGLDGWEKTKSSIASSKVTVAKPTTNSTHPQPHLRQAPITKPNQIQHRPHAIPSNGVNAKSVAAVVKLPSYLLPPSYPSDPHRSSTTPLALSGTFTNTHFRTLHIIYRKSLRPKFHAPPRRAIRPEIMALHGTEMEVDETAHTGIDDVFVWKVGMAECEVLERFMQECEFSHGVWMGREVVWPTERSEGGHERSEEACERSKVGRGRSEEGHGRSERSYGRGEGRSTCDYDASTTGVGVGVETKRSRRNGRHTNTDVVRNRNADGSVHVTLGHKVQGRHVEWGWSVEQLAQWLCRVVVGEVVREEEWKAKQQQQQQQQSERER